MEDKSRLVDLPPQERSLEVEGCQGLVQDIQGDSFMVPHFGQLPYLGH